MRRFGLAGLYGDPFRGSPTIGSGLGASLLLYACQISVACMMPSSGLPILFILYTHERADAIGDAATVIGVFSVATLHSPAPVTWKTVPTARVAKVSLAGRSGDGLAWAAMKGRNATAPPKKMTPNSMNNLAELYRITGRYQEAELIYKIIIKIYKNISPKGFHPDYALCLNNLALVYRLMGNYKKAEPFYKQAVNIYKKHSPAGKHPDYAALWC